MSPLKEKPGVGEKAVKDKELDPFTRRILDDMFIQKPLLKVREGLLARAVGAFIDAVKKNDAGIHFNESTVNEFLDELDLEEEEFLTTVVDTDSTTPLGKRTPLAHIRQEVQDKKK
ncbi:hypothetical protein JXA63_04085 [Candidatus Woesebacteria bacterium]|nr:hypothetical protein [Candidatus Woesebacteria bacterium]